MTRAFTFLAGTFALCGCAPPDADYSSKELYGLFATTKPTEVPLEGQSITVRGAVLSTSDSWLLPEGWTSLALHDGGTGKGEAVVCNFPPENASQLRRLRAGDTVLIRGVCKGRFALDFRIPMLSDCERLR